MVLHPLSAAAELESNPVNKASLAAIDTAMFVVALDQIDAGATLSTKVAWGLYV